MKTSEYFESKSEEFKKFANPPSKQIVNSFFDEIAIKFSFKSHEKIAFIVVAHPTDTFPSFLRSLSKIGNIASILLKGLRLSDQSTTQERVIVNQIEKIYGEAIDLHIDRDKLSESLSSSEVYIRSLLVKYPDFRFIICDHGGYFASRLFDLLNSEKHRFFGIVEHTLNGENRYKQLCLDKGCLPFPVFSIAKSPLKALEDIEVGKSINDALALVYRQGIREHMGSIKKIMIIGYGNMGQGVAHAWRQAHSDMLPGMIICDLDEKQLEQAKIDFPTLDPSHFIHNLEERISEVDLIIIATDRKIISRERINMLKDHACLAGVTSQDDLFEDDAFLDFTLIDSEVRAFVSRYERKDPETAKVTKTIYLAAGGKTINFLIDSTAHPILHAIFAFICVTVKELIDYSKIEELSDDEREHKLTAVQCTNDEIGEKILNIYKNDKFFGKEKIPTLTQNIIEAQDLFENSQIEVIWRNFLNQIKIFLHSQKQILKFKRTIYISHTNISMYSEEHKVINNFLQYIKDDLNRLGIQIFCNCSNGKHEVSSIIEGQLDNSDAFIFIGLGQRTKKSTIKDIQDYEIEKALEKSQTQKLKIIPILLLGESHSAFPTQLQTFTCRDCTGVMRGNKQSYRESLFSSDFGVIPYIYDILLNDTTYKKLLSKYNFNLLCNVPIGKLNFCGRKKELDKLSEGFKKSSIQTITGLSGIGKSQLAIKYATIHKEDYHILRWITSNKDSLYSEVISFASDLGVNVSSKDFQSILRNLWVKLKTIPSWLLIFDNAKDLESIKPYFNEFISDDTDNNQHILITSRSSLAWATNVHLEKWEDSDVEEYAKSRLSNPRMEDVRILARKLNYLPIVIDQAITCMRNLGIDIKVYLESFKADTIRSFSGEEGAISRDLVFSESFVETWSRCINDIRKESKDAFSYLQDLAYLAPDNILVKILQNHYSYRTQLDAHKKIAILKRYSLIEEGTISQTISIHSLLQLLIRNLYPRTSFRNLVDALSKCCIEKPNDPTDFELLRMLIPHIESLLGYLGKKDEIITLSLKLAKIFKIFEKYDSLNAVLEKIEVYFSGDADEAHFSTYLTLVELYENTSQDKKIFYLDKINTLINLYDSSSDKCFTDKVLKIGKSYSYTSSRRSLYLENALSKCEVEITQRSQHPSYEYTFSIMKNLIIGYKELDEYEQEYRWIKEILNFIDNEYKKELEQANEYINTSANFNYRMGLCCIRLNRVDESISRFFIAIKLYKIINPNHLELGYIYISMSSVYEKKSEYRSAYQYLESGLAVLRRNYTENNDAIMRVLSYMANVLHKLGEADKERRIKNEISAYYDKQERGGDKNAEIDLFDKALYYAEIGLSIAESFILKKLIKLKYKTDVDEIQFDQKVYDQHVVHYAAGIPSVGARGPRPYYRIFGLDDDTGFEMPFKEEEAHLSKLYEDYSLKIYNNSSSLSYDEALFFRKDAGNLVDQLQYLIRLSFVYKQTNERLKEKILLNEIIKISLSSSPQPHVHSSSSSSSASSIPPNIISQPSQILRLKETATRILRSYLIDNPPLEVAKQDELFHREDHVSFNSFLHSFGYELAEQSSCPGFYSVIHMQSVVAELWYKDLQDLKTTVIQMALFHEPDPEDISQFYSDDFSGNELFLKILSKLLNCHIVILDFGLEKSKVILHTCENAAILVLGCSNGKYKLILQSSDISVQYSISSLISQAREAICEDSTEFLRPLKLKKITGSGHCLFEAVSACLNMDTSILRSKLIDHLERNVDSICSIRDNTTAPSGVQPGLPHPLTKRKGLKKSDSFKALLSQNLDAPIIGKLGSAFDNGDCFFDSLAQLLNEINNTTEHTVKTLRMACHEFYTRNEPNKNLVDQWNKMDYGQLDSGREDYYFIQYSAEELSGKLGQHFQYRSPIWGRPLIEGRLLCRQLQFTGLVIELIEDPESKQHMSFFYQLTGDGYESIDEINARRLLENPKVPTLLVEQHSLHFIPIHHHTRANVTNSTLEYELQENFKKYIDDIRQCKEWGDEIEISLIQAVINRPIIVLKSEDNVTILGDIETCAQNPIYIFCNENTNAALTDQYHYDALLVESEDDSKKILNNIVDELKKNNKVNYSPASQSLKQPLSDNVETPYKDSLVDIGKKKISTNLTNNTADEVETALIEFTEAEADFVIAKNEKDIIKLSKCITLFGSIKRRHKNLLRYAALSEHQREDLNENLQEIQKGGRYSPSKFIL